MPAQKKSILTAVTNCVLLLLTLLIVFACATPAGTESAQQHQSNAKSASEAIHESSNKAIDPIEPLSAEAMYRVMAAELEGNAGEVRAALSNYLEAALVSNDPEIAKRATVLAARAGSWQHAAMAADRWLMLDPENIDAARALATAHITSGNYKAAAYQLDQLFAQTAGSEAEKWQQITPLLTHASSDESALELFKKLLEKHQLTGSPKSVASSQLAQSQLAVKLGDMKLGLELGAAAAAGLPEDVSAQLWTGSLLVAAGLLPESIAYFKRAWEIDPIAEESAMAYAEVLHRQKNSLSANAVLAALKPTDKVMLNRIVFAVLEEAPQRAQQLFQEMANSLDKNDPGHPLRMARAADLIQLTDEARDWYARVPETDDDWFSARLRLAVLITESEGLEQGRALLEPLKADERAEIAEQAWLGDSQLLQRAQKFQASIASLNKGLERFPDSAALNYSLGLLYAQADDVEAAEMIFHKILSQQPNNAAVLNALGYTLADQTDRYAEAYEYIKRALELRPDEVAAIDSMGWVLFRMGRYEESLQYLRRAYRLDENVEIAVHLIEVLWLTGQQTEAKQIFNKTRETGATDPLLISIGERLGL